MDRELNNVSPFLLRSGSKKFQMKTPVSKDSQTFSPTNHTFKQSTLYLMGDSSATESKKQSKLRVQFTKKTLTNDQLQEKKNNKKLAKYFRQLGGGGAQTGVDTVDFKKTKEEETKILKQIIALKEINQIDHIIKGETFHRRNESEKRAIIDNEYRKIKLMKELTKASQRNNIRLRSPVLSKSGAVKKTRFRDENGKRIDTSQFVEIEDEDDNGDDDMNESRKSIINQISELTSLENSVSEGDISTPAVIQKDKKTKSISIGDSGKKGQVAPFAGPVDFKFRLPSIPKTNDIFSSHKKFKSENDNSIAISLQLQKKMTVKGGPIMPLTQNSSRKEQIKENSPPSRPSVRQSIKQLKIQSFLRKKIGSQDYDQVDHLKNNLSQDVSNIKKQNSQQLDGTTVFSSNKHLRLSSKNNNNLIPRQPLGTPHIQKSTPIIKSIRPIEDPSIEYQVLIKSPLDLESTLFEEKLTLMPTYNFLQTIKPPKVDAQDLYNKIVYDKIKQRQMGLKIAEKKPPLFKKGLGDSSSQQYQFQPSQTIAHHNRASSELFNKSMTVSLQIPQENADLNQGTLKKPPLLKKASNRGMARASVNLSQTSQRPKEEEIEDEEYKKKQQLDINYQLRLLQEMKSKLNDLLKDNQRQIDSMNEDTRFYKDCRDLIYEVFNPKSRHSHTNSLNNGGHTPTLSFDKSPTVQFSSTMQNNKYVNLNHSGDPYQHFSSTMTLKDKKPTHIKSSLSMMTVGEISRNNQSILDQSHDNDSPEELIPLMYVDKKTNKTVVKLEVSLRDKKKVQLVKALNEIRYQKNKVARVLDKVLQMYDLISKQKFEKEKNAATVRTLQRIDQKSTHLQQIVQISTQRFNFILKEKTRILDAIFNLALPKKSNPLAKLSDLPLINSQFLNSVKEDQHAFQSKINTIGLSGDLNLNQRLSYLNLMHKSFNLFQQILARKVQQVQISHIKSKRFSPRNCVLPSSMDTNIIIENFDLGKNYFSKVMKEIIKTEKKQKQVKKHVQSMHINKFQKITPVPSMEQSLALPAAQSVALNSPARKLY